MPFREGPTGVFVSLFVGRAEVGPLGLVFASVTPPLLACDDSLAPRAAFCCEAADAGLEVVAGTKGKPLLAATGGGGLRGWSTFANGFRPVKPSFGGKTGTGFSAGPSPCFNEAAVIVVE